MKFREMMAQLMVDLKTMTFKEKVEHIWTNFKEWIVIFTILFGVLIAYIVTLLTNQQPVLEGYLLNVTLSDPGRTYITEDYFASIGGTKKQTVQLHNAAYVENPQGQMVETNYAVMTQLAAVVASESLDFIISDEYGMELGITMELYLDLNEFLSEDELTQWKEKLIYAQAEGTDYVYPVALDISDTAFAKDHITVSGPVYIGFAGNAPHLENCHTFLDYLLSYE